jgi:SEC-C motif-containing protein
MRARYCAYAKRLADYVLATWHPAARPPAVHLDPAQRWTGLRLIATVDGGPDDATGSVEFEATVAMPSGTGRLHEVSRVERIDGRWAYRSGRVVDD